MRFEIKKHWDKLKKISKLSDKQLQESFNLVLSKISFINEEIIPSETWLIAEVFTLDIDIDDTDFVALTKFLRASLWTGDKILYEGLKNKRFKKLLNTSELIELRRIKDLK